MAVILPSTATPAVASLAQYQGGAALVRGGGRGGGAHGNPPFYAPRDDAYNHQPPVGVVVGAGAVGALAGRGMEPVDTTRFSDAVVGSQSCVVELFLE